MAGKDSSDSKKSFRDSLNLPQTDFPIRPNPKEDDPAMIARWQEEDLYRKTYHENEGNPKYICMDGPPYANGNIHLGHAYNKILKDIITKARRMAGFHTPVQPGWDCHGLPIEIKVTTETPNLSKPELIQACRNFADHWIGVQMKEFKRLGILMNWHAPWKTMDFSYEAQELRALGQYVQKGYINRSKKTVPWCPSCQTVLATAEIEYEDRKDPSLFVRFPLTQDSLSKLFPNIKDSVSIVIWTTTPWTIPLNRAVLVKPHTKYALLKIRDTYVLVGADLAGSLCKQLNVDQETVQTVDSSDLAGLTVIHPLMPQVFVPILEDTMVQTSEGTAFVHCAPGAGPQDYETGVRNKLEIFSPVNPDGTYDKTIQPRDLVGVHVNDGQIWVIKKLHEDGYLLHKSSIRHSYPHCWRCRGGLIYRATQQWFFDLTHNSLKSRTLAVTDTIKTLPEKSINRLQATIEARFEWCISRQRVWGVPIPALLCTACDYTYTSKDFIDKVAAGVEKEGVEYWNAVSITDLVGTTFTCPSCSGNSFQKEQDILDVWFDAGLSHYMILHNNPPQQFPADLYLEGKDQHRGFFQSSLLTAMALEEASPMKMILTHGFTVDEHGIKMSKSRGNVTSPGEIIDAIGTDGLRLWASSVDYAGEAIISETLIKNVQEVFRKVRNTCRFLLSNLYDFDIEKDAIAIEHMRAIDQQALRELFLFNIEIQRAYKQYDYTELFHRFGEFVSVNLSTFYLEIVKDCLYVEKADGHARRSVQTACWYILDTLTRLMAPVLSFTAEHISDLYQKNKTDSIHLQRFTDLAFVGVYVSRSNKALCAVMQQAESSSTGIFEALSHISDLSVHVSQEALWNTLKLMRSAILKATEKLRETGDIKRSLDAKVVVYIDSTMHHYSEVKAFFESLTHKGESSEAFFKDFAIVSQFSWSEKKDDIPESSMPGLYITVEKALGVKCPRCWQWAQSNHKDELCDRCEIILQ